MKLGFKTKGDFQAFYFRELVSKYFEGGNAVGQNKSVGFDIKNIVTGLSLAWDEAESESGTE